MTLPALVSNYQKKQTAVRVKKVYSELLQAIRLSEAHNGDFKDWSIDDNLYYTEDGTRIFIDKYIKPYYHSLKECGEGAGNKNICGSAPVSGRGVQYAAGNGTALSFVITQKGLIHILVDLNPRRKSVFSQQNLASMGKDVFYFDTYNYTGRLMPTGWVKDLTREMALKGYYTNGERYSCKKLKTNEDDLYTDYRHACTALIMIDGWEFKDDYPW